MLFECFDRMPPSISNIIAIVAVVAVVAAIRVFAVGVYPRAAAVASAVVFAFR